MTGPPPGGLHDVNNIKMISTVAGLVLGILLATALLIVVVAT